MSSMAAAPALITPLLGDQRVKQRWARLVLVLHMMYIIYKCTIIGTGCMPTYTAKFHLAYSGITLYSLSMPFLFSTNFKLKKNTWVKLAARSSRLCKRSRTWSRAKSSHFSSTFISLLWIYNWITGLGTQIIAILHHNMRIIK